MPFPLTDSEEINMKRSVGKRGLCLLSLVVLLLVQGCGADITVEEQAKEELFAQEETATEEKAPVVALVLSSMDSPEEEALTEAFTKEAEAAGVILEIEKPEVTEEAAQEARAITGNFILYDVDPIEYQMLIVNELVARDVDVIAIHANHPEALESVLSAARAVGIRICAFEQSVTENSCDVYVEKGEEAAKAAMELIKAPR